MVLTSDEGGQRGLPTSRRPGSEDWPFRRRVSTRLDATRVSRLGIRTHHDLRHLPDGARPAHGRAEDLGGEAGGPSSPRRSPVSGQSRRAAQWHRTSFVSSMGDPWLALVQNARLVRARSGVKPPPGRDGIRNCVLRSGTIGPANARGGESEEILKFGRKSHRLRARTRRRANVRWTSRHSPKYPCRIQSRRRTAPCSLGDCHPAVSGPMRRSVAAAPKLQTQCGRVSGGSNAST